MKPWCTYRTSHPTGFFYEGKGKTEKVLSGEYKGSGTRFNLALTCEEFSWDTWSTVVIAEYDTEEAAYEAEEKLVTLDSLANPYRLNLHAGGTKGRYKDHGRLLRQFSSEKKKEARRVKKEKETAKKLAAKEEIKRLKLELKKKET